MYHYKLNSNMTKIIREKSFDYLQNREMGISSTL